VGWLALQDEKVARGSLDLFALLVDRGAAERWIAW
jgi:hypothetical protein